MGATLDAACTGALELACHGVRMDIGLQRMPAGERHFVRLAEQTKTNLQRKAAQTSRTC